MNVFLKELNITLKSAKNAFRRDFSLRKENILTIDSLSSGSKVFVFPFLLCSKDFLAEKMMG